MDQEKIGRFIAECRKKMNLTQQELADKLGVSDRTGRNPSRHDNQNGQIRCDHRRTVKGTPVKTHLSLTTGYKQRTEHKNQ